MSIKKGDFLGYYFSYVLVRLKFVYYFIFMFFVELWERYLYIIFYCVFLMIWWSKIWLDGLRRIGLFSVISMCYYNW